jgi:hypothetical protein
MLIRNDGTGGISLQDGSTTALFVGTDSTYGGKVGIGTTAPTARLSVFEPGITVSNLQAHVANFVGDGYQTAQVFVGDSATIAADVGGEIQFGGKYSGNAMTEWAACGGYKENATSGQYGGYFAIKTRPHAGSPTERMRIQPDGKIGIGTTAPIRLFDLTGSLSGQYAAALINTSTTGHGLYIKGAPNSASYMALSVDDQAGTALFNVRGDRRVGISTNAPGYTLDVRGTTSIGTTSGGGILRLEGKGGLGYAVELRTDTFSGLWFKSNGISGPVFNVYNKENSFGVGITPSRGILQVAGAICLGNVNEDPHITKSYGGGHNNANAYTIDFTSGVTNTTGAGDYVTITWAKPGWSAVSWEATLAQNGGSYKVVGGFYHNGSGSSWSGNSSATVYNGTSLSTLWQISGSSDQTVAWRFWIAGGGHHPHIHMRVTGSGGSSPDPADFTVAWTDAA